MRKRLLLRPEHVSASRDDLEVIGVFNPGATEYQGRVLLFARVAEQPREKRVGFVALPRWTSGGELAVDWLRDEEVIHTDPRVVTVRASERVRLKFISHLLVVDAGDGLAVDNLNGARFFPREDWEEYGVEDPRITRFGDRYWITYVAVSRHGAATALASTQDFRQFTRHGIIFAVENKDVVLFPEVINDQYVALHRPNGATPFTMPEMWVAHSKDLIHWGRHEPLFAGQSGWETGRVGAGAPPIRTEPGWLEIYHGNQRPNVARDVGRYVAAAMILDADDPRQIVRQSVEPLFIPTEPYECEGFVRNVVFPTGIVSRDDSLLVYYGASDTYSAVVEIDMEEVLSGLQPVS